MSIEDLLRLAEAYSSKNSSETGSDTYSEIESTGRMAVAGNAAAFLQKTFQTDTDVPPRRRGGALLKVIYLLFSLMIYNFLAGGAS